MSVLFLLVLGASPLAGQAGGVRGKLTVKERGGKFARDVTEAVIWLEGPNNAPASSIEVATRKKELIPGVVVVAPGSTIAFPNYDPFNHNVFSVSPEASFDLGLYGRGVSKSARFDKPGIIRVYCNVHAQMGAVVVVLESPFVARPGVDGGFAIEGVPPGAYTVRVWHDRGGRASRNVEVGTTPVTGVELVLDASEYRHQAHLNKFGKPYQSEGRRY